MPPNTSHVNKAPGPVSIPIPWQQPFLKFGHGGAAGHAQANTLHSLELALEVGVDVVEFDVRPCRDALVLLHDDSLAHFNQPGKLASQTTLQELRELQSEPDLRIATLAEALDLLSGRALMNIDLKADGYEREVLEFVRSRGITADVIFSTVIPSSLRLIRAEEPHALLGLSYPEDRGNSSSKPYLKPVVSTVLFGMRLMLPYRVLSMMAGAQANAVMLYHKILSRQAVRVVQGAGGRVFTWTVDSLERMGEVKSLGVNGITTNFPDLFDRMMDSK